MPKKLHYSVVLTKEARNLLSEELNDYLLKDKYFNCIKIEPNGAYLFMQIEKEHTKSEILPVEISIPNHYVLYIISAVPRETLGL